MRRPIGKSAGELLAYILTIILEYNWNVMTKLFSNTDFHGTQDESTMATVVGVASESLTFYSSSSIYSHSFKTQ